MALPVDICNWALLRLGQPRINSIDPPYQDAYGISAVCAFAYPLVRDAELRANVWSFALARKVIAEDTGTPAFGDEKQFRLPNDFLRMVKKKCRTRRIEGEFILACEDAPLDLTYVRRVTDATQFDPLFVSALSCSLAMELAEKITTSTTKKQDIARDYSRLIDEAKAVNAIEKPPVETPEDTFVTVRR